MTSRAVQPGVYAVRGSALKSANEAALDLLKLAGITQEADQWTASQVYGACAWIYRCVSLRAASISRLPYSITLLNKPIAAKCHSSRRATKAAQGDEVEWPHETQLPDLLWRSEASLCLEGVAYWMVVNSLAGTVMKYRWLTASTITPQIDKVTGLTGFVRSINGTQQPPYPIERIVHIWLPDPDVEIGPGRAPVSVALAAAGVSINIDRFASAFFQRGAIPATILQVEGGTPEDRTRLEVWWKKLLQGVKRAWETVAVPMGIKPIIVGSPIKDLAVPDLENQVREKICATLGVAESIAGQAANYAVSKEDYLSFYRDTIIPEAGVIEAALNAQVFHPQGLAFAFNPEELDIMQEDETNRAQAFSQYVTGGVPVTWVAQMLGLEAPEGHTWEELDQRQREDAIQRAEQARLAAEVVRVQQTQAAGNGHQPATEPQSPLGLPAPAKPVAPKALLDDLRKWREKAKNRGADKGFASDYIPSGIKAMIADRLSADAESAFAFLKQIDDVAYNEAEKALQKATAAELAIWWERTVEDIRQGRVVDYTAFAAALENAIDDVLVSIVTEQVLREAVTIGVDFDVALINSKAWEWARTAAYEKVKGLTETTRKGVQDAVAKFVKTPGMTNEELRAILEPTFGKVRAEMIGTTEVTNAFSQGTLAYQEMLQAAGLDMEAFWLTRNDELVCIICGPLNGKSEDEWKVDYPHGPAAHTRCRCGIGLRLRRQKRTA